MTMGDNCDKGYLEIKERLDGINGNSLDAKVADRLIHEFNLLAFIPYWSTFTRIASDGDWVPSMSELKFYCARLSPFRRENNLVSQIILLCVIN